MFELIKNILLAITGGWRELSEKYGTKHDLPKTFLVTENQRITFKRENKSGSMFLNELGIGVLDYGLYLSSSSMFVPLIFFACFINTLD